MRENVLIYGRYFGLSRRELKPRIDELLDFVQLTERAGDKVEPLSGGMKRRLTIARSLVNDPDLLLLDEPTTGLDPQARHVVWDRLFRLKQQGKTFVADDALHGRGGAALRPARRHGPRRDRRRGVAVGADPALLDARGRRDPLRGRAAAERRSSRASRSASRSCRTAFCSTHATATRPRPPSPSAGCRRTRRSSGGARSRTSSSTSPAAPSSTDDGQRPPAAAGVRALARPVPARLAGHDRDEPRQPDPLRDGARGRARHDRRPDAEHARRRSVSRLHRAGPARRRRDADRHDRVELAGDGRDQVVARLPRDDRDAADRAGRASSATSCS